MRFGANFVGYAEQFADLVGAHDGEADDPALLGQLRAPCAGVGDLGLDFVKVTPSPQRVAACISVATLSPMNAGAERPRRSPSYPAGIDDRTFARTFNQGPLASISPLARWTSATRYSCASTIAARWRKRYGAPCGVSPFSHAPSSWRRRCARERTHCRVFSDGGDGSALRVQCVVGPMAEFLPELVSGPARRISALGGDVFQLAEEPALVSGGRRP